MAKFNVDNYKGVDLYSDGIIEDVLLEAAKNKLQLKEINEVDMFPVIYHLTKVRENILNWYPFKANCTILEIGGGCGGITSLLCEKAEKVTCIELSKKRASINYERNKDKENLEIIVGNMNDIKIADKYDYIILNGVYEYAASFTEGDEPYYTFLMNMKQYLKQTGIILISIENRIGVKYFAGAPEDHTGVFFEGINGYKNNNWVRTFSKNELNEYFAKCGFKSFNYYYPYPDYKFPYEIYSDRGLNKFKYGRKFINFSKEHKFFFSETELINILQEEKVMDKFANSFLIEVSIKKNNKKNKIDYVKCNMDRAEPFRINTEIKFSKYFSTVKKRALSLAAEEHLKNMLKLSGKRMSKHIRYVKMSYNKKSLDIEYIKGDTFLEVIKKMDSTEACHVLVQFFDEFFSKTKIKKTKFVTNDFMKIFGENNVDLEMQCIEQANIDMQASNIIYKNGEYIIIDPEWVLDFFIPIKFIVWRALAEVLFFHKEAEDIKIELYARYKISKIEEDMFMQWTYFFATTYVENEEILKYQYSQLENDYDMAQIYIEKEEMFSEDNSFVSMPCFMREYKKVQFDLQSVITNKLRFDPAKCQGKFKLDKFLIKYIDGTECNIEESNVQYSSFVENSGYKDFMEEDPHIIISGFDKKEIETIVITYDFITRNENLNKL